MTAASAPEVPRMGRRQKAISMVARPAGQNKRISGAVVRCVCLNMSEIKLNMPDLMEVDGLPRSNVTENRNHGPEKRYIYGEHGEAYIYPQNLPYILDKIADLHRLH